MFRIASATLLIALFMATVHAQDTELARVESDAGDAYREAVTNARKTHTPEQVDAIKDSETKWRAYRNAECKAEDGGDACLIRMTKERIAALKALYLR